MSAWFAPRVPALRVVPFFEDLDRQPTPRSAVELLDVRWYALRSDVASMLQDLLRYVDFGPRDAQRLTELRPHAATVLPAIADEFYERILASPDARSVLGDPTRTIALKQSLISWMDAVLAGPHDETLFERARQIGHTHVKVKAPPRYVLGGMACIRNGLARVAMTSLADVAQEVSESLSKMLDLQAAVIMEAYAEHWFARMQAHERAELARTQARADTAEWAFEQAAETANMVVIGLDAKGHIVLFNAAASRALGLAPEKAMGEDAFALLFGEAGSSVREEILSSPTVPPVLELAVRGHEGGTRMCRFYLSRHTPWGADRPTHLLTAIDCETEARERRTLIHRGRSDAIRHLGSGFAHEVRNPLNGAVLAARLLRRSFVADEEQLRLTVIIEEELGRIKSLTDDFLAFASPRALVFAPVDIGQLCARVVEKMRTRAPATTRLHASFPREPLVVEADEETLEVALSHLVLNAIEALPDGAGSIHVFAVREPAHAVFHVEDDGPGLDAPNEVVFDTFFTTKSMRHGLGLAIAQRTAFDHGGSIEVASRPGKTVFSLRLPLLSPKQRIGATDGAVAEGGVLVIDQHRPSAATLATLLARDGYDAALEEERRGASVVVTSLNDVEPSTKAVVAAVRQSWPRRTVLFTTPRPRVVASFLPALGARARVVPKPVDYAFLKREVHLALQRPAL